MRNYNLPEKPINPPEEAPLFSKADAEAHREGYCDAECVLCQLESDAEEQEEEEGEQPMARAIRERIESTEATQRGRPWTPLEFALGYALPHSHRERPNA